MDKYEYCENIIKEKSESFYKAFSELEPDKAKAVYAIYAFCREADDAIDEHNDLEKVNTLKANIKKTFEGNVPEGNLLFEALADTFKRYPSQIDPYLELLDGIRDDYYFEAFKTEDELEQYCYKVAGTVGLMLLPVIASENYKTDSKKLKEVAVELGKAMQLTNILRDVRNDLMKDRVYFSEEIIEQHQVKIEMIRTGLVIPEWRSMMEYYIDKTKNKYKVFYDNVELFDKDARLPTMLAASYYEGILDEIAKKDYSNINKRHYVGNFRKRRLAKQSEKSLKKQGLIE